MSPSPLSPLVFAIGCAAALSSCSVFKKDEPQGDAYDAAKAYNTAAGTTDPYGNTAGYDAANAYAQPNAYSQPSAGSQPYTAPPYNPAPTTGPGYGAAFDSSAYPPPAAGNPGSASGRTHVVVRGDTLSGISRRYGVGTSDLMRANNLNSDLIREGQKLNIP